MAQQIETAWMKSPTGEMQEVPVDGTMGEFNQKLVAGWNVCEPPAAKAQASNDRIKN